VAAMRWSELNLEAGTWELSGDRTKNEEPTLIPLSTLAVSVPQSVPKTNDTFVFPARGNERSHFSGYAKGKKALDGKVNIDGVALENWTLHDLRRTLATNLGRRQVLPHVIEHILNHKAASLTDIGEIYNLYTYVKEKREVLQMWSNHIEWLIKQAAETLWRRSYWHGRKMRRNNRQSLIELEIMLDQQMRGQCFDGRPVIEY
ncbi:tyrosine-type recombinase/integrase, partial [Mesorhizobium sp. M00.F.Ca.ET.216.01.1.1]